MASLDLGGSIRTRPRCLDAPTTSTVSADRFGCPRPAGPTHDRDPIASSIPVALVSAARAAQARGGLWLASPSDGLPNLGPAIRVPSLPRPSWPREGHVDASAAEPTHRVAVVGADPLHLADRIQPTVGREDDTDAFLEAGRHMNKVPCGE